MPQYSLSQLIQRANAGQIGQRGLKKLANAGIDTGSIVHQGLGAQQLGVDPQGDLGARRAALFAHAVEAAHSLQPGQTLSAGLQRRLSLGAGGPNSQNTFTPRTVAGVQAFQGDNYSTIMDALRKRSQGIASQAGIYKGF